MPRNLLIKVTELFARKITQLLAYLFFAAETKMIEKNIYILFPLQSVPEVRIKLALQRQGLVSNHSTRGRVRYILDVILHALNTYYPERGRVFEAEPAHNALCVSFTTSDPAKKRK